MNYGRIVVSVFIRRLGLQDGVVHPLMSRTGRMPLRSWNTGFIWFTVRDVSVAEEFHIPNLLSNDERMRLIYSPRWMNSSLEYTGTSGETLARTQFTFPLDGELRTDRYEFFDGSVTLKYAGQTEGTNVGRGSHTNKPYDDYGRINYPCDCVPKPSYAIEFPYHRGQEE